ncbi:hypothetical protein OBBRIDRAFT_160313 [Obba rivulosa]|uniref:Uncharacterized protein n=1 Tax=Obba rivulosa TaxID=1052685 RepID=A0A8E2AS66_9APHY|nr:hypothetical protein OBBRIDRAFT_160313 [Obba rivulosa]
MATAVLPSSKLNIPISHPLQMAPHKRTDVNPPLPPAGASSSRLPSLSASPEPQPKTFKRLRSSLEQSIRTATRSRVKSPVPTTDFGVMAPTEGKGKERASEEHVSKEKEKSKSRMLSKVSFRRTGARDNASAAPPLPASERKEPAKEDRDRDKDKVEKVRVAGHTSFQTPSLRLASMSTPAVHLSSQAIPSPYSQPFAFPAVSSSNVSALVSPTRDRSRRASAQPPTVKEISGPAPLAPKRDARSNGISSSTASSSKSRPPPLIISSAALGRSVERSSPGLPETPTRRPREGAISPDLTPPSPTPRGVAALSTRRAAASASHLPLGSPPASPTTPRPNSPLRARSSSRTAVHRPLPSASSSHLPSSSTSSGQSGRRPSLDQRSSLDQQRPTLTPSPSTSRAASPIATPSRPRAISPTQRNFSPSYSQNRFLNTSTTSLGTSPSSPEFREQIRAASAFLCKEMLKPPSQLSKNSLSTKEWEDVEVRLRALARLERVWGKSGSAMGSTSQLSSVGGLSSSGLSAGGEERERRLFCEALRDGYVLCQLVNKLFPGTISRVDAREDGFVRTSNVTKFLAACSSVGLRSDDLFNRDDLLESTAESLSRVARTVIALAKLADTPTPDKSKFVTGGSGYTQQNSSPYGNGTVSRAAASTPNLAMAHLQRSTSPTAPPSPMGRKRWSPPHPLPPLRSDSPNEGSEGSGGSRTVSNGRVTPNNSDGDRDEVPPIISPPPRSPLRPRASLDRTSVADSTRASVGDSVLGSLAESIAHSFTTARQSQASSSITDTTTFSSLLEVHRTNSVHNNFGTIRTVTTEATSLSPFDAPSLTFTEGSAIAASMKEESSRKRSHDMSPRPVRERRPSETAIVDLTRVEEADESGTSSKGGRSKERASEVSREQGRIQPHRASPIKLGKGKWPDDFLDAFPGSQNVSALGDEELGGTPSHTPVSISPPRKLAIVGASSGEGLEPLPQFPRRPTHRARHSVDTPGLLPKDSLLRRDSSPDSGISPSPRVMLRRSSTKSGPNRNGIYIPRSPDESRRSSGDSESFVPFPRSVEQSASPPKDRSIVFPPGTSDAAKAPSDISLDKPRQPRGRFQSEVDGSSSRRKPRPNSYDELGAKPRRSRYESMINLGVASGNASASDIMSRDSYEGSAVRQTLIVREDGKPPTQFQLGNCIGRGQFGAVYRALNLNTGQMVAVKRIRLEGLKEEEIAQLMKEVDLVKSLSHPSIVKYEGMARDNDTLSIVLEYAENGSLGQTLRAFGKLNERLVASYVVKILEGLHYLHQSDVVHCDLKAANILTTKNGNVKLSDFGVSLNLRAMEREMKDVAGTPNWMAPEVIELKGASTKSDIWSLACTVIELLTGRPPYADIPNSMSVMFRIVEDNMPPIPEGCSESLQDFLKLCFHKDPTKRPSAEALCEHEWLKKHWAHHKELRPQDSIPFLRRVSADFQKSEAIRFLANVEMPDPGRSTPEQWSPLEKVMSTPSPRRRMSNDPDAIAPREHSFVKTTFGKPVICRVCLQNVKKSAVLCEQCSLIAHARCSANAPPTCDLRAQLLLYAQYAEHGDPSSPYISPADILGATPAGSATSPTSEGGFSRRTSFDTPSQSPVAGVQPHPPTAFRVLAAFKRSRSSLTVDQDKSSSASSLVTANNRQVPRKRSILKRKSDITERPQSLSSNSTSPHSASMRSAATAAESFSSHRETARQSTLSTIDADARSGASTGDPRLSRMTSYSVVSDAGTEREDPRSFEIPGDLPKYSREGKHSKNGKHNSGCIVQ